MTDSIHPIHPKGTRARVLLSSVFGPYAQDDYFGSRAINPMELYQNQVTRVQGVFSLRMFHRSFGLMMIQANIEAPCTFLDFPSRQRFVRELKEVSYDIVGISGILPNIGKVKEMCRLIRRYQPRATIVVGGHIANRDDLDRIIDADHIVRGEGISWFRRFIGQDHTAPVRHPLAESGFDGRVLGIPMSKKTGETAAMLIPSVGCPVGCNFCSTCALFGGKGHFISFYPSGDELFSVMVQQEAVLKTRSFFILDENFLLHRKRALRLLELMQSNGKSWSLYVFSSARVLRSYSMDELVRLGISWVWMGLEGKDSRYQKLKGVDTRDLVTTLQAHGIMVLGSSIIGMEDHTVENLPEVIDYAVSHGTDFHQFMLYTPIAGTPLHAQHQAAGSLLSEAEFPAADAHGQYRFNYRHPHIPAGQEQRLLLEAFSRDFEVNGPSLARLIRTCLQGFKRYKDHPDLRIRNRYRWEARSLPGSYAGAVWAMRRWFRADAAMAARMDFLLQDLYSEFGAKTRLAAPVAGRWIFLAMKREERRLRAGWTYEPECFYEKNAAAAALDRPAASRFKRLGISSVPIDPVPALNRSLSA